MQLLRLPNTAPNRWPLGEVADPHSAHSARSLSHGPEQPTATSLSGFQLFVKLIGGAELIIRIIRPHNIAAGSYALCAPAQCSDPQRREGVGPCCGSPGSSPRRAVDVEENSSAGSWTQFRRRSPKGHWPADPGTAMVSGEPARSTGRNRIKVCNKNSGLGATASANCHVDCGPLKEDRGHLGSIRDFNGRKMNVPHNLSPWSRVRSRQPTDDGCNSANEAKPPNRPGFVEPPVSFHVGWSFCSGPV